MNYMAENGNRQTDRSNQAYRPHPPTIILKIYEAFDKQDNF